MLWGKKKYPTQKKKAKQGYTTNLMDISKRKQFNNLQITVHRKPHKYRKSCHEAIEPKRKQSTRRKVKLI